MPWKPLGETAMTTDFIRFDEGKPIRETPAILSHVWDNRHRGLQRPRGCRLGGRVPPLDPPALEPPGGLCHGLEQVST